MNQSARQRLSDVFAHAHPVLLAGAAVTTLAAANAQQVDWQTLAMPLPIVFLAASLVFAVIALVIRPVSRAAIVATLVLTSFLHYGRVYHWLWQRLWTAAHFRYGLLAHALCTSAFVVIGTLAVRRMRHMSPSALRSVNIYLSTLGVALLGVSTVQFARYQANANAKQINRSSQAKQSNATGAQALSALPIDNNPSVGAGVERPDIYYIIADGYARSDVLADVYGYDNGPFLQALSERGFYVAAQSSSNYSQTYLSLSSTLSMEYLDEDIDAITKKYGTKSRHRAPFYARIRNPGVVASLRRYGYQYATVLTNWGGTDRSDVADTALRYPGPWARGEFTGILLSTTALRTLTPSVAQMHNFTLTKLREMPKRPGPKFVFVHLLLPHNPYVFDRDGNETARIPMSMQFQIRTGGWREKRGYIEQVRYVNTQLLTAVDTILSQSIRKPVIIIQGDHGSAHTSKIAGRKGAPLPQERMAILNAYYVSDRMRAELYPTISPVNTFRTVLRSYFGEDLAALPDKQYFSWYRDPYGGQDVTELLQAQPSVREATQEAMRIKTAAPLGAR